MTHVCIYLQLEPVNANTVGGHRKSLYKWGIQGKKLRIKRSDLIHVLKTYRRNTLYNIINNTAGKFCSIAFLIGLHLGFHPHFQILEPQRATEISASVPACLLIYSQEKFYRKIRDEPSQLCKAGLSSY